MTESIQNYMSFPGIQKSKSHFNILYKVSWHYINGSWIKVSILDQVTTCYYGQMFLYCHCGWPKSSQKQNSS